MYRSGQRARHVPARLLLVLAGAGRELALHELAQAAGVYHGSARYALVRMIERGVVRAAAHAYSLAIGGDVLAFEIRNAARALPRHDAMRLLAAVNPAVELVSVTSDGTAAHTLLSPSAEPRDVLRLRGLAKELLGVELIGHDQRELLGGTIEDQARLTRLRELFSAGVVVKGDLERLPRPGVRGAFTSSRPLHRPHPSLPRPPRRALQRLARRYGLSALSLFGSSVRPDFRPDSDVDVLVRYRPGVRRSLTTSGALRDDLAGLLGRRIDLVDEDNVYPAMAATIARDVVRMYGRSRAHALASRAGQTSREGRDRRTRAPRRAVVGRPGDVEQVDRMLEELRSEAR